MKNDAGAGDDELKATRDQSEAQRLEANEVKLKEKHGCLGTFRT